MRCILRSLRNAVAAPTARLVLVTCLMFPAGAARAVDCIDYAQYLHWETSVEIPGYAHDVATAGGHAYVVHGHPDAGLTVVDLQGPGAPAVVGSFSFPVSHEDPRGIAVVGDHAYVVREDAGTLDVFDISTPTAPDLVGSVVASGSPRALAVSGSHAFVAGEAGLDVIDVSTPESPALVGFVSTGYSTGVDISGDYAYVAANGSDLRVVHVVNPSAPIIVGNSSVNAHRVTVVGLTAYVSDQTLDSEAVHVVTVVNPAAPMLLGSVAMPSQPHEIAVSGGYAYVADLTWALQVVDVSEPTLPSLVGSVRSTGGGHGVAVDGDVAYVASTEAGLEIMDISNPLSPPVIESVYGPGGTPEGFAFDGTLAYVAGSGLFSVLDITVPDAPVILGTLDLEISFGGSLAVHGAHVYVCDESAGIRVIDVTVPESPVLVRTVATQWPAIVAAAHAGFLYVGYQFIDIDPEDGYYLFDLTIPDDPQLVLDDPTGRPRGFAFSGNLAYVAGGPLRVLDVSTPQSPIQLATLDAGGTGGLELVGDELYLANDVGLQVIDVSDPSSPEVARSIDLTGSRRVAVADGIAYVHRHRQGLWVVDVARESVLGNIGPTSASTVGVAIVDNSVYYAAPGGGVAVWPTQCEVVAVAEPGGAAHESTPAPLASPNPFTASARLTFSVPKAGPVSLEVFDVAGRLLATRDLGWRDEGIHAYEVVADGSLGHGVFFARLRTAAGDSAPVRLVSLAAR